MFLHVSVILFTGGGLRAGRNPPRTGRTPRAGRTLGSRHPPGQTPPRADIPLEQTPPEQTPPQEADCSIRPMSGRYASYWNAFLLKMFSFAVFHIITWIRFSKIKFCHTVYQLSVTPIGFYFGHSDRVFSQTLYNTRMPILPTSF